MASLWNWVTEQISRAVHQDRDISVGTVQLGDHCRMGFRVRAHVVSPEDPLLGDPNRKATTTGFGGAVSWVLFGGGIYPGASFSVPVGPASLGFSADAELSYAILAPYPHSLAAVKVAATNLTMIPLHAADVAGLAEGSELVIRGTGNVAVGAGSSLASTLASFGSLVRVTLVSGIQVVVARSAQLMLRVKKLDGSRVLVSLLNATGSAWTCALGIVAGASSNVASVVPRDLTRLPLGSEGLAGKVVSRAISEIDEKVAEWLRAHVIFACSRSNSITEAASYTFELSGSEAAGAYESLMKLDTRGADAAAGQPGSGVRSARWSETSTLTSSSLQVGVSKLEILSCVASVSESRGRLDHSGGTIFYDRAVINRGWQDIVSRWFAGKLFVTRELVRFQRDGTPSETYLHVRYEVTGDYWTSRDDVQRFVNLVTFLKALDAQERSLLDRVPSFPVFSKTDRTLDVFISHAGLRAVFDADVQRLRAAHAAAFEKIDGRRAIWMYTSHPQYESIISYLEQGPQPDAQETRAGFVRDQQYRAITYANLEEDSKAYKEFQQLSTLLQTMKGAPSEQLIHVYAQAERDLGIRFERELAMLASVAGPAGVIVAQASIVGKNRQVVFQSNGTSPDRRGEIESILNNP
jgi:hypothetical protein